MDSKRLPKSSQSRSTTPIKTTIKRSSSVNKLDNINSSNSKPRLSRCLSNSSSKRDLLLKSIKKEDQLITYDVTSSIDTTQLNTTKIPVNLSSEENVKHLIHCRDDLLNNIHNVELELKTAINNMSGTSDNTNNTELPTEFKNLFKERFDPITDDIKNKLIEWLEDVNFIKENSLTHEMLSQVLQNG